MDTKKCLGCGVVLQDENITNEGYTTNMENDFCQRCFRMKHYGEYEIVSKSNDEYLEILEEINNTNDLVLHVVDVLNVDEDLNYINEHITNKKILVLNKRDVLPLSVNDDKTISYFKEKYSFYDDIVLIGTRNNYNYDELFNIIKKYKTSNKVYLVGRTNAGKSSIINKLMSNYSINTSELTISPLPSTTLDTVSVDLSEDLTLIDTPGLVDVGNITNYIDNEVLDIITPKKEIKPRVIQVKEGSSILVGDILRIDILESDRNSFSFYMSNDLDIGKISESNEALNNESKRNIDVLFGEDLVIDGLGFIKIVSKCNIDIYLDKRVDIFTRDSMI